MSKRNAVAVRDFTHADDSFTKGQPIPGMSAGQFADWESVGLVRAATVEKPAAKPKATRRVKVKAPAAAPASPEPAAEQPTA